MKNLPEVRIQDKDGKWHKCLPFIATVKGGKAVIYTTEDGTEIKREPLARYTARDVKNSTAIDTNVKEIVEAIVLDICDRRDLKCEWNKIDLEIQENIKEDWTKIIKSKLKE